MYNLFPELIGDDIAGREIYLLPAAIQADGAQFPVKYKKTTSEGRTIITGQGEIADVITLRPLAEGFVCERVIKNSTEKTLKLKELAIFLQGIDFGKNPADDYFYCNENLRLYGVYTLPIDYDRSRAGDEEDEKFGIRTDLRWRDPGAVGDRILISPYQPFPAIHIGNYRFAAGFVHGSLSQDIFYHNYSVKRKAGSVCLSVYSSFKAVSYRLLQPGEELSDKWYFGITKYAGDIDRLFENYTKELRKHIKKSPAKRNPNKTDVVWGSWNDGIYRDVSEKLLIREAEALKKFFPGVKWVQLDDGYSAYCEKNVDLDAHGIGVAYEGSGGIDTAKFPDGLHGFARKIRSLGLHPAIWIGGLVPHKTKMYREHPEWFIDYAERVPYASPLDVSRKEARNYMLYAMDNLLAENGFEGLKYDFWSYAFEDSGDLLKNKEKSGYEYRKWWLNEVRSRLPEEGYMQSGCDLCMGNPFLGEYFDNYRFGMDIGSGKWENVKNTLFWGCACFPTHTGDLFIPNGDAIGLMRGLSDDDFIFLLNYLLITHSLVEISGIYSDQTSENFRVRRLRRAVNGLQNGSDVYFAKFDYRQKNAYVPQVMYSEQPCFKDVESRIQPVRTVALFNIQDAACMVNVTPEDIGLKGKGFVFTEVWEKEEETTGGISAQLPPHGSKLYYVSKKS